MRSLLNFCIFSLLFTSLQAVNFVCPNGALTTATLTGAIPTGANSLTNVPANTNCTVKFNIPNGYAVKLVINNSGGDGDSVIVTDTFGKQLQTQPKVSNAILWLTAGTASLNIISPIGTLSFYTTYQFVPLTTFAKRQYYNGQYFSAQLDPNTIYTMSAKTDQDKAVATVGRPNSTVVDSMLDLIFVYDNDIYGQMLGRLSDLVSKGDRIYASGQSLAFVCLYDQGDVKSVSIILGNDKSTVANFSKYRVVTLTQGRQIDGQLSDATGPDVGSAVTFICTDCKNLYINKFAFDSFGTFTTGYCEFRGNINNIYPLIRYEAQEFLHTQLPQLIPTGTFTMFYKLAKFTFTVSTDSTQWFIPYDRRTGVIISPNQWDETQPSNFDITFRNNSQLFTFALKFPTTEFESDSASLAYQVGPANGALVIDQNYPKINALTAGPVSGVGNFMRIAYSGGSAKSNLRLPFSMEVYNSGSGYNFIVSCLIAILVYLR